MIQPTTDSEQLYSQTLAKALLILEAFSLDQPEWGIRELGRHLDINPTTIFRYVKTLHVAGYLEQNTETGRYALGPKVLRLAGLYTHQNPLAIIASKVFESYVDRFEYNFYLGKLNQFEVIYLAVLDGRGPIKIVVDLGGTTALHSTALGKVLLASQNDAFIREFLETVGLHANTPNSVTDPGVLWEQIRQIRQSNYAVNHGEHYENVGAVGVPVYDRAGRVVAGVSLAYPTMVVQEQSQIEELVNLAREIASEISMRHSGRWPSV
jgi:DNA-binding IclR family transcriptional regulator